MTRKEKQIAVNETVRNELILIENDGDYFDVKPLRYCRAAVYETAHYYVLESYRTYVAAIRKSDGAKFDFLRYVYKYTSTSNQHIAKFFNDYSDWTKPTYRYYGV